MPLTDYQLEVWKQVIAAKKPDPKAKVRNRGDVVFPAESKKVKDDKDHFPINDANQARNALSRVAQFTSVPPWFSGTLSQLQSAVRNAVKKKYPGIEVTKPKKKGKAADGPNFNQGNPYKGPNKPRTKEVKCPPGHKKDKHGNCVKS